MIDSRNNALVKVKARTRKSYFTTRLMVCRSPTDRENVSVGLKREWSWNLEKSQAYFPFLDRTPFPRSPFRPAKPRYARFDNWPSLRSRKRKSSLSEWKVRLRFFLFLDTLFPALQNIYSLIWRLFFWKWFLSINNH